MNVDNITWNKKKWQCIKIKRSTDPVGAKFDIKLILFHRSLTWLMNNAIELSQLKTSRNRCQIIEINRDHLKYIE
jgi:hypothetical protein